MKSFHNFNIFIAGVIFCFFSFFHLRGHKLLSIISVFLLLTFLYRHYKYFGFKRPKTDNKKVTKNFYMNQIFGICSIVLILFIIFHMIF
jgi:hypothetical protein